jgi:hypothetical protein
MVFFLPCITKGFFFTLSDIRALGQDTLIAAIGGIGAGLNGENVWKGMGWGALSGAVLGGLNGYSQANKLGIDPWSGTGDWSQAMPTEAAATGGRQWQNTEEMFADYNKTIGAKDGIMIEDIQDKVSAKINLASNRNLSEGVIDADGNMIWKGKYAAGVTSGHIEGGWINKNSTSIFIAPQVAGKSIYYQNVVFKHEFMHAWHWSKYLIAGVQSEKATSTFTYNYGKHYYLGNVMGPAGEYLKEYGGNYPAYLHYRNFGKIIPTWLK